MLSKTRYLDLEGAIRSGKTTVLVWKCITTLQNNPGMWGLLSRWTQDSLDAQLKPRFWELCPPELLRQPKPWNGSEEWVAFENGSRLYMRALKSSDEGARYVKTSGLGFAFIGLDQPEEVPRDIYAYLKGRLSQKGYPQQMVITPNPPDLDHWLCEEFPSDKDKEGYEYIHFSIYDNRHNLEEDYIKALEVDYPVNHPMRRRLLLGRRGAQSAGKPVYGKVFKPQIHVGPVSVLEEVPLIESWDFSFSHPAVSWSQFTPWGTYQVIDELQGKDIYLDDFIPVVLARRRQLIKPGQMIWSTADPSGASQTSHGIRRTAVGILVENGITPVINMRANRPEQRIYAVQHVARLMLKLTEEGPALQVHPRCATIIDGFSAGYAYPEKVSRGLQVPHKDGFYDHLQNTIEYAVLAFLIPDLRAGTAYSSEEDEDEREARERSRRRVTGRAGY